MQKTAQKRSVLNKLREMTNVSGKAAEAFFNPQFKEVMEHIRKKDDQIRTFVVGKKLGDAETDPGGPALKDILKQAKSNLNRREFMSSAHDLATFHERVKNIVSEIQSINHKVDDVHNEFLFDKLTPEQQEKLRGLKTRFAQQQADLVKTAGIMDFFHNIGTSRGRGLAAWEKRYPKKVNEIKNGIAALLQKSESLLASIIDALKEMASARSVRNIDDYIRGSDKIIAAFNSYEKIFREFYFKIFKKYVDDLESYQKRKEEAQTSPTTNELLDQKVPVDVPAQATPELDMPVAEPPSTQQAPAPIMAPELDLPAKTPTSTSTSTLRSPVYNKTPEEIEKEKKILEIQHTMLPPPPKVPAGMEAITHKKFYSSLQSLSNESPIMLALFINKYASSIKTTDPKTANKLLQICKQIRG